MTSSLSRYPGTPAPAGLTIKRLTPANVGSMLVLQDAVHESLPDDQKASIVLKNAQTFQKLVTDPHHGIGVFSPARRLIGQLLIGVATAGQPPHGLSACDASSRLLEKHETAGIVQSVLVHNEWRNRGVMDLMLRHAETAAADRKLGALLAEVAVYNRASAKGFHRQGYVQAGSGFDPEDGTPLIFLERRIAAPLGAARVSQLEMLHLPGANEGRAWSP